RRKTPRKALKTDKKDRKIPDYENSFNSGIAGACIDKYFSSLLCDLLGQQSGYESHDPHHSSAICA
ncbi:MAG: hypothetical protein WCX93_12035, partial [Burkholderiaceae bacterium]